MRKSSDLFGFCIFFKGNPPWSSRSHSSALSNDARFTRRQPSQSYDANVFHFVLHTSSLISLLSGSVQVGSAQHCFREQWQPSDYLYIYHLSSLLFSIIHRISSSPTFSLRFAFCSSALVASLSAFSLCPHSPLFFSLSSRSLSLSVLQKEVGGHVDIVI